MRKIAFIAALGALLAAIATAGIYALRYEDCNKRMEEIMAKHKQSQEQQLVLKEQINDIRNRTNKLESEALERSEGLETALRKSKEALTRLRSQIGGLEEELYSKVKEIEALQKDITSLEKEKRDTSQALRELKATHVQVVSDFEKELKKCQTGKAELQRQVGSCRERILSLEKQIQAYGRTPQEINREITELRGDRARLAMEVNELKQNYEAAIAELRGNLQNKEVIIDQLEEQLSITVVEKVLFEFGKSSLTTEGKEILREIGKALQNTNATKVCVVGHTDPVPIHEDYQYKYPSNWELSAARAAAVVRYLQDEEGIDPVRLEVVGRASYDPTASNETAEGRALNRRVQILIGGVVGIGTKKD